MIGPTAEPPPGSTASLRPANQRRVVEVLRAPGGGSLSQADIARATGLATGTVSNIVRQLTSAGLVETEPGAGRRGTVVRLAAAAGVVAGVDFGHTHLAVAVADLSGGVLAEAREPLAPDHAWADGLDRAAALLGRLLRESGYAASAVRGLGMGLPAPISDDVVRSSAILPGWVGVNAGEVARARFGCPVHVDNDANLGALAEHRVGAGRGQDDLVYVKVSSGVGAGLVLGGRIFRGSHGSAGELGHLTLDEQGPLCRCGSRGCLEAYASSQTAIAMMSAQLPDATIDDIVAAARAGNVAARRLLEDAGLHVGWGLATLVNLLNPGVVVVGGDMARAGDLLLEPARLGLRRHALPDAAGTPVVLSRLGGRAFVLGAVALAAEGTDLVPELTGT